MTPTLEQTAKVLWVAAARGWIQARRCDQCGRVRDDDGHGLLCGRIRRRWICLRCHDEGHV